MILYISFEDIGKFSLKVEQMHGLYIATNDLEFFQELKMFASKEEFLMWLDMNTPNIGASTSIEMKPVKIGWQCKVHESMKLCIDDAQARSLCKLCGRRSLVMYDYAYVKDLLEIESVEV